MEKYYIPFTNGTPAAIEVKGHRVLLLTSSADDLMGETDVFGACEIREVVSHGECDDLLADLAAAISGGVILAPEGTRPSTIIENLWESLPWIH